MKVSLFNGKKKRVSLHKKWNKKRRELNVLSLNQVSGCSGNLNPEDLIKFLSRHASIPLNFGSDSLAQPPNNILISVERLPMAKALLRLSGIRYAGDKVVLAILFTNSMTNSPLVIALHTSPRQGSILY